MTVGEMSPGQLYGLILLAFVNIAFAGMAFKAKSDVGDEIGPNIVYWFGLGALLGLPAINGIMVLLQ